MSGEEQIGEGDSCAQLALIFLAIAIVLGGFLYFGGQSTAPRVSRGSAAPTSRDYSPDNQYAPGSMMPSDVNRNRPTTDFTMDWDKVSGVLKLDASKSAPGFQYSWYFGWSVALNTGTTPSADPLYTIKITDEQITDASKKWVMLTLINDKRQIVGSVKQFLP